MEMDPEMCCFVSINIAHRLSVRFLELLLAFQLHGSKSDERHPLLLAIGVIAQPHLACQLHLTGMQSIAIAIILHLPFVESVRSNGHLVDQIPKWRNGKVRKFLIDVLLPTNDILQIVAPSLLLGS